MKKPVSFFKDINKTINIFSLQIEFRTFLIIGLILLAICLFCVLYFVFKKILIQKKLSEKNIKTRKKNKYKKYNILTKLINSHRKEELELKLIHSGYPLGIKSIEIYYLVRILFTIGGFVLGLELYNPEKTTLSILLLMLCGIFGYFVIDIIFYISRKNRNKEIKQNMPIFLVTFDNYAKSGLLFDDILDIIPFLTQGVLQEELIKFNVSYFVSKDFEGCMKEFTKRIGISEAEEIEIKMRQCYYSGIYDDVLTNEKEMIEKKVINDLRKETEMFDIYLALGMGLLIINIFVLIVIPLLNIANEGLSIIYG